MKKRPLYLVAYDIRNPSRLRRTLEIVKEYATGGQKSAYECYLNRNEQKELLQRANAIIDRDEDNLFLLCLNQRPKVHTLGVAVGPQDPTFFYQG
ncbi:MAG: CRISPR-associated endonuclease Cas2 [Gammaproteobacteria bacterium]|jgi:CRISPR-associated protein Cas2|nr:CRISPR-associated endonuclease Cas2 [Gammaproteobacteria bacterium]MBT4130331.1 CRISPR-associated endonuclease Cas2 [Candidatus Neomarinimicrobiota bacterium]MBT7830127.1 CRISPR-associated endonuclease Cas2 [Candidatus Neomarinimicrobiota bacterium]